jgi:hypothetical protein
MTTTTTTTTRTNTTPPSPPETRRMTTDPAFAAAIDVTNPRPARLSQQDDIRNKPTCTWKEIFDTNRTRLVYAGLGQNFQYTTEMDAQTAFSNTWTTEQEKSTKKVDHEFLNTATQAPAANFIISAEAKRDGIKSLFPCRAGGITPVVVYHKQVYLSRYLMSSPTWNKNTCYGKLLATAFFILDYLAMECAKRDHYDEGGDERHDVECRWSTVRPHFVNSFVSFLIHSCLQGPNWSPRKAKTINQQDVPGVPHYICFVLPILKMAKLLFPRDFSFVRARQADLLNFVRNQKRRLKDKGVYSCHHLEIVKNGGGVTCATRVGQRSDTLKGVFYGHYRCLLLVSKTFDPKGTNLGKHAPRISSYNCSVSEIVTLMEIKGFHGVPSWSMPVAPGGSEKVRKRFLVTKLYHDLAVNSEVTTPPPAPLPFMEPNYRGTLFADEE